MILEAIEVSKEYKIPKKSKSLFKNIFAPEYKKLIAVDNISININKGETIGYIGLNGAGKSTTIKLMTGILTPTGGSIRLFGEDLMKNKLKKNKRISVVFGQRSNLWYDLPVIDSFKYIKELYEITKERYEYNLKLVTECLELGELLTRPVRKLSLGQKMKCELGAALLYDPEILFLDEPTIGLDIFARDNLLTCIHEIRKNIDTTIFLTTHNMDEINKLCERIIVLDKGRILFDGTIDKIKDIVGDYQRISFLINETNEETIRKDNPFSSFITSIDKKGLLRLNIDKTKTNTADIMKYYFSNYEVKDVNMENNSLEQLIKELYKNKELRT